MCRVSSLRPEDLIIFIYNCWTVVRKFILDQFNYPIFEMTLLIPFVLEFVVGSLIVDRNLPVLRRNELKSCMILMVEQTNPKELLHP